MSDTLYLVQAAQAGNGPAMELLLDRHRPLIEGVAARFARRPYLCDPRADLRQDARLAFVRAVHAFRSERSPAFIPLATVVMHNHCSRTVHRYVAACSLPPAPAPEPAAAPMEATFHRLLVAELVRTLPERDQALIARTYGLGGGAPLSATAAGRTLGLTPRTARRRLRSALRRLRGQLRAEE